MLLAVVISGRVLLVLLVLVLGPAAGRLRVAAVIVGVLGGRVAQGGLLLEVELVVLVAVVVVQRRRRLALVRLRVLVVIGRLRVRMEAVRLLLGRVRVARDLGMLVVAGERVLVRLRQAARRAVGCRCARRLVLVVLVVVGRRWRRRRAALVLLEAELLVLVVVVVVGRRRAQVQVVIGRCLVHRLGVRVLAEVVVRELRGWQVLLLLVRMLLDAAEWLVLRDVQVLLVQVGVVVVLVVVVVVVHRVGGEVERRLDMVAVELRLWVELGARMHVVHGFYFSSIDWRLT